MHPHPVSMRGIRLAVLILLCFAALLATHVSAAGSEIGPGSGTARPPGIVSLQLARQVARVEARNHFLRDQQTTSVRLEISSTIDVAPAIRQLGGTVEAIIGAGSGDSFTAATLPASAVRQFALVPGVRTLYPAQHLHLDLDRSVPEIRANQAWTLHDALGLPVQGRHVLVGIIDSGIDYRNQDFRNPDGSTRIVAIWDQSTDGKPPAGFHFGFACDAASINNGSCPERDTDGHGTHVAGIAAGNGRSSLPAREVGVAPQADIVVVKSDLSTDHILAAWTYLMQKARALHEPIVINNSFGGMLSPHDGSAPDSLAADKLGGPGRIFVMAAGNEGSREMHTDGSLHDRQPASINFAAPGIAPEVTISAFYPARDDVTATLTNLDTGQTFGPIAQGAASSQAGNEGGLRVSIQSGSWNSHFHELDLDLSSTSGADVSGRFQLTLQIPRGTGEARYDAWIADDDSAHFSNADESDTIGDPADGHSVISVGNYATRVTWIGADNQTHNVCDYYICRNNTLAVGDIKPSSSQGPTADGRQKPDISAPGTMIVSSLSADAQRCTAGASVDCLDPAFITPDGKNYIATGTSMSAPHVAGVIALMLQADPNLDPATIASILRSTARHDQFTGTNSWTPAFGAGKVDAYAAVEDAVALRPTVSLLSLRTERSGSRPDSLFHSAPLARATVGKPLDLSIYVRVEHAGAGADATFEWIVRRSLKPAGRSLKPAGRWHIVARQKRRVTLASDGTMRELWSYTPDLPGRYSVSGSVTAGGTHQQTTARFTVLPRQRDR
ncbi:MAG: S8 family serine peptidase [Chloroflexota bacterium]|nr:S8 family serine peptidase [Chloroflexota bacterium]